MPYAEACPYSPTSRRDILKYAGIGLAAAAVPSGMLLAGSRASAQTGAARPAVRDAIMRTIPSSNEAIPAIGLGTFLTFDVIPGQKRDHLRDVVRTYWEGGARVVDTSPLYGTGEITVGDFATSLGISDQLFVANKIWSTGEYLADESHALRSLGLSEGRLWRQRLDLMQCHSLVNVDVIVPYLRAWKKEGRIRYTGVTHFENPYMAPLISWIERGNLDFVQVNYSIFNRQAEERLLPAAAERGDRRADQHAVREGAPVQGGGGARAAGLCPRDRRHDLGAVLPQMGDLASERDVRAAGDVESRACRREHRGVARPAARSRHARAHGAPHGDHPGLQPDRADGLVSRQALSRHHRAVAGAVAHADVRAALARDSAKTLPAAVAAAGTGVCSG